MLAFGETNMSVEQFERIEIKLLRDIRDLLRRLFRCQCKALSSSLVFVDSKGEEFMDVTVHLNDPPLRAALVEFDGPNGAGNIVPGIGPTSYTSADPTVATVDPVTGNLAYLKAGQTLITGKNSGNGMTATGNLTVISGAAQSAALEFIAQSASGAPVGLTPVQAAASLAAFNAALAAGQTNAQAVAAGLAAIATAVAHGE
jgi:hypothetical protein